jgi:DNA polymerase-3 subunit gamma/tau
MSYQVLARKWRPTRFADTVGQEHVLRALVNALDQGRLHQAYLFTGTRGVGKTTLARIVAKAINCEKGVSSTPCGECSACTEIDAGRFIDLIEVDAASRTKVDDTRELLDNVQYTPTRGRYKVYLIDEVHMLSTHSFNALLKTLEEPPPHVTFLLATTDPQRLPPTILSRCLQFNLKRMPLDLIEQRLVHILDSEGVEYDTGSLKDIAQAADGSRRDALSLLDQAVAYCEGGLKSGDVADMLGYISREPIYEIVDALQSGDAGALLRAGARLEEVGADYAAALDDLLTVLQHIALTQWTPEAGEALEEDGDRLKAYADGISREDVQLYYQIALIGKRDLPLSPNPRRGFEMVLLRMLAFRPAGAADPPAPAAGSPAAAARAAVRNNTPARASEPAAGSSGAAAPATESPPAARAPVQDDPPARSSASADTTAPADEPAGGTTAQSSSGPLSWKQLCRTLGLKGMVAELAANCAIDSWEGDRLALVLSEQHSQLYKKTFEERLQKAVSDHLGKPVRLHIRVGAPPAETPAGEAARLQSQRRQSAVDAIEQDETVKAFKDRFGATVQTDSIRPLDGGH